MNFINTASINGLREINVVHFAMLLGKFHKKIINNRVATPKNVTLKLQSKMESATHQKFTLMRNLSTTSKTNAWRASHTNVSLTVD